MANSRELKSDTFNAQKESEKALKRSNRFRLKSWCEEYHWLRKASGFLSYVIQILAIAAAFYGAKLLAQKGFENITLVVSAAIIALVTLEGLQRHSSDKLWDGYWSKNQWKPIWISLSLLTFALTTSIGSYGTFRSVNELGAAPTLITNDSILNHLLEQEKMLGREIESIEKQTDSKGIIFYKIQDRYDAKLEERSTLSGNIAERRAFLESNNKVALVRSSQDVERDAWTLVIIFITLGLSFEVAMCFNSFYDFREECEEHESNPGEFLRQLGIRELHPTIAAKYPSIAAHLNQSKTIGFKMPQASSNAGFMKNYTPPNAQAKAPDPTPPPEDTQTPPPPAVEPPVDAATIVATGVEAATKPIVATNKKPIHTVEFMGIKDPEDVLRMLLKRLSPYNSNLNNPKRNSQTDSAKIHEYFSIAEKLDWNLIGEELKRRWVIVKKRIEDNINYIKP